MRTATSIAALAIVAAAGFGVGRTLRSPGPADVAVATEDGPRRPVSALPSELSEAPLRSWRDLMRLDGAALIDSDWQRLFDDTVGDSYLRAALVRRWAKADPVACWRALIAEGEGGLPHTDLARIAVTEWAAIAPEQAFESLFAMGKWESSNDLLRAASESALLADFDRGAPLLREAFEREMLGVNEAVKPWMEADGERATRLLASLPIERIHSFKRGVGAAARVWFRSDPAGALAWSRGAPHDLREHALGEIAEDLVERGDTEALREILAGEDSMMILQQVGRPLRRHLQHTDPAAAAEWLFETFDGRMLGAELGNLIGTTSADEFPPHRYVEYFDRLPEGEGKLGVAPRLFDRWAEVDGPAAADWLASIGLRGNYGGNAPQRWANKPEARQWLQTAAPSRFADDILRYVVRDLNPAKARQFATTLPAERAAKVEEMLQD